MVAVPKERSFPRGGREDQSAVAKKKVPDWCKKTSKAFDKKTNGRNRNKPFVKKTKADAITEEMEGKDKKSKGIHIRPYTGKLKYNAIAEGMLILGSVYRIKPYELGISLPGNCMGEVPITNISEPYTRALASLITKNKNNDVHHLRDIFRIGQHVVTKVVKKEVLDSGDRHKIILSLVPEVVHSECSSEDVLEETVFTATVVSVQEKGYVMDLGIKSVRAFLKKENSEKFEKFWNKGKALGIGQLVRCLVTNVTTADLITTVVLTSDPELVVKASNNNTGSRLQGMLPGMLFKVTVARHVFPGGIQVRLSDNVMGYVPPNHLPKNFKKPEDFEVGRVHSARIIYISASGAIFFSMKNNIFTPRPPVSPFKVLKAGFITDSAIVWEVSEAGLTVRIGKTKDASLKALIPVKHINRKQASETESESTLPEQLLNEFPIGAQITCRVMDYCYMDQVYICTMDERLMKEKYLHASALKVGTLVSCIVKEVSPKGLVVALGKKSPVTGFVPILHASSVPLLHPEKMFHVGQTCPAKILSLDNHVQLTMKQPLIDSKRTLSSFDNAAVGKTYPGTVVLINRSGILVEFYNSVTAFVLRKHLAPHLTHIAADLSKSFFVGQVVNCSIVGKVKETRKLILSLETRPGTQEEANEEQETNIEGVADNAPCIKEKQKKTKKTKENKSSITSVQIKLEDELDDSETSFQEKGGLKRKKQQSMDPKDLLVPKNENTPSKKLKMSQISNETVNDLEKKAKKKRKLSTASMGFEVVSGSEIEPAKNFQENGGTKKKKKKKGKSDKSTSEIPDAEINSDLEMNLSCEIKTSNSSKKAKKMKSFKSKGGGSVASMTKRLKYDNDFSPETEGSYQPPPPRSDQQHTIPVPDHTYQTANGTGNKVKTMETPSASKQKDEPVDSDSSEEEGGEEPSDRPVELPPLSVTTGFVWDATPSLLPAVAGASCEEDSSDDEFVETKKVKRSRQAIIAEKRLQAQIEEARLRSIEQRLMDPDQLPQTADEFDRLVLSSPDNSMVWLQYMAHHIQATEIEKARSIAQRALKTISFREEQEKLNVWVAWLNLENLYGTNESMKNTFEEAIRLNDPYQVYTQTLQIYADSHKLQDGDELIAVMTRKFKTNKDMWINVATFYMKSGQTVKARALLQRALASLEQKEHVSTITQFALLENKLGTKERAQTLMEQILTSYPKRVDVWSVYVDMLVKSDLFDMARQVLERAVAQRLPSHKMKTLFKKFLAFEESHGTEEGANKVRQLALDYVEAAAGTTME